MKKIILIICLIIFIALALWLFIERPFIEKSLVFTNLQVTEYKNPDALVRVINEMEIRGIKPATIFVGKELVQDNCSLIKNLDEKGYEIAIFGYALDENGQFLQLADLTKKEQEIIIKEAKDTLEDCLGHKVSGFRAQRFSQNKDTNEIIKDLGVNWHGSFVVNWHPEASFAPYYSNNYGFYIVSIEGVGQTGYVLCDTAMASFGKTAKEWKNTIQDYFVRHQQEESPFITEFHPYLLVSDDNWWDEFIKLLNWFKKQNINYLTTQQMIDSCQPVCGE